MRIIAGRYKGKRLETPEGFETRPTPSRVREALFDILQARVRGARFLDLYAGTGAVGIEALSREARDCAFVENNPRALGILRNNLRKISAGREASVLAMDGLRAVRFLAEEGGQFDLFFADPPYEMSGIEAVLRAVCDLGIIAPRGFAVVQHDSRRVPDAPAEWGEPRRYRYGGTTLSLYRPGGQIGNGEDDA